VSDELAEVAQAAFRAYGNLGVFAGRLYTVDHASIYERYAVELGKDELTDLEKKQALLDAVLDAGLDFTEE
jgi:hypothetical protein